MIELCIICLINYILGRNNSTQTSTFCVVTVGDERQTPSLLNSLYISTIPSKLVALSTKIKTSFEAESISLMWTYESTHQSDPYYIILYYIRMTTKHGQDDEWMSILIGQSIR